MDHGTIAVGLVEVFGLPPAVFVADAMVKAADVRLVDLEVNTLGAMTIKVTGAVGAVRAAFETGERLATELGANVATSLISNYSPQGIHPWIEAPQKITRLLKSRSSLIPLDGEISNCALGLLETRGFTGVVAAADAMMKAADVHIVSLEKIGASLACVLIRGDVAAVQAAIEAGKSEAERVGKLMSAHTIPRPDPVIQRLFIV